MAEIYLPRFYTPRPYQLDIFNAYFKQGKKRFVNVWHRRAGKDQTWIHLAIIAAQMKVGTYLHTLPTIAQAKKVVWRNIDEQGHTLFDYIPKQLLAGTPNSTELFVKFKNGSILQFAGADNFDSLRGTNPVHITFSEYSFQHPMAWDILNPILVRNKGTAAFIFTPNGQNHAHTLYNNNIDNEEYHISNLTVDDTRDNAGNYVVSPDDIQKMRDAGSSEEFIQREFYCSFNAFQGGNYFAAEYNDALTEGRILDFSIDVSYPVNTYWDIGLDTTAIWLIQSTPQGYKAIAYYEYNNVPYSHYVNWLEDFRKTHKIVYSRHYAPHDAMHREKFSGESYMERAARLGINYEYVPRVTHKIDAIEATRSVFNQVTFHKTLCKHGLLALQSYHAEYNERLKVFSRDPCHDWASHGSDSFMQFAQSYKTESITNRVLHNRVNTKSLYR